MGRDSKTPRHSKVTSLPTGGLHNIKLDATSQPILCQGEELGGLTVDSTGALCIDDMTIQNIIARLVEASNVEYRDVQGLLDDGEHMHDSLSHLQQSASMLDARVAELEATSMELRVQVNTMGSPQLNSAQDEAPPSRRDLRDDDRRESKATKEKAERRLEDIAHRLELVESQATATQRLHSQVSQCEDATKNMQMALDDMETHVSGSDDALTTLKTDVEAMRSHFHDVCARKASKADIAELQSQLNIMIEEHKTELKVLEEAKKSLERLNDAVSLGLENKKRAEEIWKVNKQCHQDLRDFMNQSMNDLKHIISSKMDSADVYHNMDDIRGLVKRTYHQLMEVQLRAQAGVELKAEASELAKLQDKIGDLECDIVARTASKQNGSSKRQLLIGNKCLSCNQVVSQDVLSLQACIDVERAHQQESLYKEVQRTLQKRAPGEKVHDVLQFVAVSVGSPRREGVYEVRDEHAGTEQFLLRSPKPLRPVSKQRERGAYDEDRCQQRIPVPLLHMAPKASVFGVKPQTHGSIVRALAPVQPPPGSAKGMRPGGGRPSTGGVDVSDPLGDPMPSQHSLASQSTWPTEGSTSF